MGLLGEFEQRLERAVEGFFARLFRSGVHPVEIGKRLLRVMEDSRTAGLRRTYVPAAYRITLSPADYERLAPIEAKLVEELEVFVTEAARQRGWALTGPPRVSLASGTRLSPGEFRIDAEAVGVPAPAAVGGRAAAEGRGPGGETRAEPRASLVVLSDEVEVQQVPVRGRVRVGRQADNDLVLPDPGVSRHHAEVVLRNGAFVLRDLGSTNGTLVNGEPVQECTLEHGDRLVLGHTVIEFRRH